MARMGAKDCLDGCLGSQDCQNNQDCQDTPAATQIPAVGLATGGEDIGVAGLLDNQTSHTAPFGAIVHINQGLYQSFYQPLRQPL